MRRIIPGFVPMLGGGLGSGSCRVYLLIELNFSASLMTELLKLSSTTVSGDEGAVLGGVYEGRNGPGRFSRCVLRVRWFFT